jgi:three-Cys-motif partner protein
MGGRLMKGFGGNWTEKKIEILVEYAKAYLKIMSKNRYWKLLYFDGFAGAGMIYKDSKIDIHVTIGAAKRIVELGEPITFDRYYFVEKSSRNARELSKETKEAFPQKKILVKEGDCNYELKRLAQYLKAEGNKKYRVLAYIDPCGMELEWASIEELKGAKVDIWILVPTGLGVNRLLKRDGNISDAWLKRLVKFLGLSEDEIKKYFYKNKTELTLFGEVTNQAKEIDAISKSAELYKKRLNEVFDFVSEPFVLLNSKGTTMYHLFMASNNKTALKIANDIIKKYNRTK